MNQINTLTVLSHYQQNALNGGGSYTVSCECGNIFTCYKSRFDKMTKEGCGKCFRHRRSAGKRNVKYKHGGNMEYKKEYSSYHAMIRRCYDPNFRSYKWYGAIGITVCDRWKNKEDGFSNFLKDMGVRPKGKPTIDRIDNKSNYEPSNCRWASWKTQLRHTNRTKQVTINGETLILTDWHKKLNVSRTTYYRRIKAGMTEVEALTA